MKKLFIFQENKQSVYRKELDCAWRLSFSEKDILKIEIKNFHISYLISNNIQVVIANALPIQFYYILKGLKIVTIIIGELNENCELADIVIDFKSKNSTKYFTGSEYSMCRNMNDKIQFSEITNLINKLEWDSNFFNFNISYLSCRHLTENVIYQVNEFVKYNNIKLVEYLSNCHDSKSVALAEQNQFHFTDIRLTLEKRIINKSPVKLNKGFSVGLARPSHINGLKFISRDIYTDSRYYFDGNFETNKINDFYQSWVEKSVYGTFDNECLTLFEDSKPVGFCTVKYSPINTAQIGLFGISQEYRGRGLALKLINSVLNRLFENEITDVYVVTQGRNYPAQRIYQKAGFVTKSTELWYHKWI